MHNQKPSSANVAYSNRDVCDQRYTSKHKCDEKPTKKDVRGLELKIAHATVCGGWHFEDGMARRKHTDHRRNISL